VGDASMELPLPLVPVHTRTERRLLNQMMLRATEAVLGLKQLALTWVSSVDERDVYPKHETHLRLYVAQWERNSRARKVTEQAATGVAALRKFNAASPSSATGCSSAASVAQQAAAASTRGCPRAGSLGSGRWRHAHRTPCDGGRPRDSDSRRQETQTWPARSRQKSEKRRRCGVCNRARCPGSGERALCTYKGANKQGKRAAGKQIANKRKP